MKYLLLLLLSFPLALHAQDTTPRSPQGARIFTFVEKMPEFPGGEAALTQFIRQNLQHPPQASQVHGLVVLQFVVDLDGTISDAQVVKKLHPDLDAEALRLVRSFPKFVPGRQNGKPVAVRMVQPLRF